MKTQFNMFADPAEQTEIPRPTKDGVIRCRDLSRSIVDCHRVEDAIAARLGDGMSFDTLGAPPAWCSQEAWERIAKSMQTWATIFGNLSLFWTLRRKRDE